MLIIVRFRILVLMCKWYMVEEAGNANSEIVFRLLEDGLCIWSEIEDGGIKTETETKDFPLLEGRV